MLEDKGKNRGRIKEIWAAHDHGKVVNPIAIQGQIEGAVLMSMAYALTHRIPYNDGVPQDKYKYGTLGLLHATDILDIHAIYVEKEHLLPVSYGGKGIGEIATIGTAPAVANAHHQLDGELRWRLPLEDTPYARGQIAGDERLSLLQEEAAEDASETF